jgi:hypothetical protein
MRQTLKQRWQALSRGRAGQRFQDRYTAAKKSRQDASWGQRGLRVLWLAVALIALGIAVLLMFLPGPAVLFYFLAGTLLARESLYVARLLDWIEVQLRALWKRGLPLWKKTPVWGRVLLAGFVLGLSAASTYISYHFVTS